MPSLPTASQWGTAVALVALAVVAVRDAWRSRDRAYVRLACSIVCLAAVATAARAEDLIGPSQVARDVAVVALLAAAYGLVLFRDLFFPKTLRARRITAGVFAGTAAFSLAVRFPHASEPLGTLDLASAYVFLTVWAVAVLEPAVRFAVTARKRHHVQRARLRALSFGYLLIVAVLVLAVVMHPGARMGATRTVMSVLSIVLVPSLYVALSPPRWVRRRWRAQEERALRVAVERLLVVESDADHLMDEALAWGTRMLGGDGGVIASAAGDVVRFSGMPIERARAIASRLAPVRAGGIVRVSSSASSASVVAVAVPGTDVVLGVASGPFTPLFGDEELATLRDYAVAVSAALQRSALVARLQEERRRSDALLQAIGDLGEGFVVGRDGIMTFVNDAFCSMLGYTAEELYAMPTFGLLLAPEAHDDETMKRRLRGEAIPGRQETLLVRKDGSSIVVETAIKTIELDGLTYSVAVCRDVTERRRAFDHERRRAEQLSSLSRVGRRLTGLLGSDELCVAVATEAREIVDCAYAAVELASEGRVFADGEPARDGVELRCPIVRADETLGVLVLAGKHGGFDDIDVAIAANLASFAAESLNVARLFAREREVAQRLRELDEMKNSFLTAVSHELRTPLTTVMGFAATLAESGHRLEAQERRELTDRLVVNARKLNALLSDLLDLDRLRRGIIEPVRARQPVDELVRRTIESLDGVAARRVYLDLDPVLAEVDGPKVERIVENLVSNAMRHTRDRTPIWVGLHGVSDGIEIVVADAGPGVPADLRNDIFEPFKQGAVAKHSPGVGIGLSLVARFAQMHGGRAWVTDRPGGGAEFHVFLACTVERATLFPRNAVG